MAERLLLWMALAMLGMPSAPAAGEGGENLAAAIQSRLELLRSRAIVFDEAELLDRITEAAVRASDPGGSVMSREAYDAQTAALRGRARHAGVRLHFNDGAAIVERVFTNSAAQAAGIQEGDEFKTVNEQSLDGLIPPEILDLLRPDRAGPLNLEAVRAGERIKISLDIVETSLPGIESVEVWPGGVVYARLNGLYPGTGAELADLLGTWAEEGSFGFIVDLRRAGGDDFDSVHALLNRLAPPGVPLYAYQNAAGESLSEFVSDDSGSLGLPLMVLIGPQTQGAAEVFAAACQASIKGVLTLGDESSGSFMLREFVPLDDQAGFLLATRRLQTGQITYDGKHGLRPDLAVADSWYDDSYTQPPSKNPLPEELEDQALRERVRGDGPLSRATDLLRGLKALNIRPHAKSIDR